MNYILTHTSTLATHIYSQKKQIYLRREGKRRRRRRQPFRTGFDTHQRLFDQKLKLRLNAYCHISFLSFQQMKTKVRTSHRSLNTQMIFDMQCTTPDNQPVWLITTVSCESFPKYIHRELKSKKRKAALIFVYHFNMFEQLDIHERYVNTKFQ